MPPGLTAVIAAPGRDERERRPQEGGTTMPEHDLWILVMNSTRARILRGLGPGQGELVLRSGLEGMLDAMCERPALRRQQLRADELAFRRRVVALLEAHRMAGDFGRLAVFAPRPLLPEIRAAMPGPLRGAVVAEVARNLIRLSEADLPQAAAAALGG